MDIVNALRFPVLKDIPPLPQVTPDEYMALLEEAREWVGTPEWMREGGLEEGIPVRFRLVEASDSPRHNDAH